MSNYNASLNDILNGLEASQKPAKYKTELLSQLEDLLAIPAFVQQLSSNSKSSRNDLVTWDSFFRVLDRNTREYAERHMEAIQKKGKSAKSYGPNHQLFLKSCSMLMLVASKANAATPHLSCRDTISCCLETFECEEPFLREILSETYVNILSKSILTKREYWGKISLGDWSDLLKAALRIFSEAHAGKLKTTILSCINLICFHGSKLSGFTDELRKMLDFAADLIDKVVSDLYILQLDALQLCFTLCHQLKKEFRFTVCKFGEKIMPRLIEMFEASCGNIVRKKDLLAKLISEIVSVHHPCGVLAKAPGSYAEDWDSWTSCISTVYRILSEELDSRMGVARVDSTLSSTISLLVDMYKQTSASDIPGSPNSYDYDDSPTDAKRRKVLKGIEYVLDNLKCSGIDELWPWLWFLQELLNKYPEAISAHEFEMIFVYLREAFPSTTSPTARTWCFRCITAVVARLNYFRSDLSFSDVDIVNELDKFMNTALSVLGLSKKIGMKNLKEAHALVQSLLRSGLCSSATVQSVLELFLDNKVPMDFQVLKTLLAVCQASAFPETSPVRERLLRWLIVGKDLDDIKLTKTVAEVSLRLLCRTKDDSSPLETTHVFQFRDEEFYFLESTFDYPPKPKDPPKTHKDKFNYHSVIETLKTSFVEILDERTKDMETMDDQQVIQCHVMLLHSFFDVFSEGEWGTRWEAMFNKSATLLVGKLEFLLKNAASDETIPKKLDSLVEFFKAIKQTPSVACTIRTEEISNSLFSLLKHFYNHHNAVEDEDRESEDSWDRDFEQLLMEVSREYVLPKTLSETTKILSYLTYEGYQTNDVEDRLLSFCLLKIDLSSPKGFKMAMIVLQNLLYAREEKLLNDDMLNLALELLKNWWCHHDEFIEILKFLRDLVPLVFKTAVEDKYKKFCSIVSRCTDFSLKKFASSVLVAVTHLVGSIIKMKFCVLRRENEGYAWNEEFGRTIWGQPVTTPIYLKFDWLLKFKDVDSGDALHLALFLKSPFNEVRVAITEYIPYIYKYDPICEEDAHLQRSAFKSIVKSAMEAFLAEGNVDPTSVQEELLKRSCCALRYLTCIAAHSPLYRRKSLFSFFELVSEKRINIDLAKKALRHLRVTLNLIDLNKFLDENASFIILCWYQKSRSLTGMPYDLLDCKTYAEFLSKYKAVIVPIFLEERDVGNLEHLCEHLSCPTSSVIMECFPEIMAMMLPKLAETPNPRSIVETYTIVEKEIGAENMQMLLGRDLDKVMIAIYGRLQDEENFERLCGSLSGAKFPQRTRSCITFATIRSVCSYLEDRAKTPNLLAYLGKDHSIHIHFILHYLRANIQNASTDEMRYLYFQQYATLANGLAEIMPSLETFGGYVVRGVVHQLLSMMKTCVELHATLFLHRFLSTSLPSSAVYVDDLLSFLVPTMAAVLLKNKDGCEAKARAAGTVLKLLMLDHAQELPSVNTLDPLPRSISSSQFMDPEIEARETRRNLSQSLVECIDHFLTAGSRAQDISFREQGLRHLHEKLCSKREELHKLYSELKTMRNFSEQCASSILHRLIISLVELATSKCGPVSELASVCLGELGPRDLTTLVLKPQPRYKPPTLPFTLVKLLLPLLVSENTQLAGAAVSTLQLLFKTKEGYSLVVDIQNEGSSKLQEIELSYLTPFVKYSSKSKRSYSCETESIKLSNNLKNWCPETEDVSHQQWITTLVVSILECCQESSFFRLLIPIAESEVEICEGLLPYLAKMVLSYNDVCSPILSQKVNLFFENHYLLGKRGESSSSIYLNRAAVQCMLSLVNFCRRTKETSSDTCIDQLHLNYLHVASAAKYCNAFFTAILYSELWADSELSKQEYDEYLGLASSSLDILAVDRTNATVLQSLLWESYEKIGESDAVHGCGDVHVATTLGRVKFYLQMKNWSQVINECESLKDDIFNENLVYALRMSGKYNMASELFRHRDYECAWRLNNWDFEANEDDYSGLLYSAIMSIQTESCQETRDMYVKKAREFVVDNYLSHASLEVANSIYEPLSKLRTLREVETRLTQEETLSDLVCLSQDVGRWEDLEPILSVKKILSVPSIRAEVCIQSATLARKSGAFQIAHKFLKGAETQDAGSHHRAILEEAQIVWESGCTLRSKYLLKELLTQRDLSPAVHSFALITYGTWLAESKSELTKEIMKNQFEKAAELVSDEGKKQQLLAADCLARFADSEYERLQQYKKTNEFSQKKRNLETFTNKLIEAQAAQKRKETVDPKYVLTLQGQISADKDELQDLDQFELAYMKLATEQYMKCLFLGDDEGNNLKVFRLVSLWLGNQNCDSLMKRVERSIGNIPSYKFLIVLNQLIVRLTDERSYFNVLVRDIIKRCCIDHPHHSLPLVLALANSYLDETFSKDKRTSAKSNAGILEPRVKVAKEILSSLEKHQTVGPLLTSMMVLVTAYVSLANFPATSKTPGSFKIPSTEPILKINKLPVPCLTSNIAVRKSGNYNNLPEIVEFDKKYGLVGGIHSPKKLYCLCSDGKQYVQLVKGDDDLRQDAGMQQVFGIMNILLRNEENTNKRRLLIRTYKVVPTSQKSGVIEWVDNTQPLGDYLVGSGSHKGAHERYRPQDIAPRFARQTLIDMAKNKKSPDDKCKIFLAVCKKMKPVLRYFFTEKYPTPGVWFERRLAYTRSIATNSMIGYILGIGDRHVANILIDLFTAEVVHIDFGITFEFGRFLPTPETIPFRLTRDIVDGMGVSGTEGIFRRCCEETLSVLRKAKQPILTALEVFLYDPLATWETSVKRVAAKRVQKNQASEQIVNSDESDKNDAEVNSLAERAVQRLKEKLEGREEGNVTSVEGQVSYLITSARNPRNLCTLFHGWQAYL